MFHWMRSILSYFWPPRDDELSISKRLVASLPLRTSTKYFTLALRHPDNAEAVVYILSIVPLSQQSALDSRDLICTVNPSSVIVEAGSNDALNGSDLLHDQGKNYPTSALHVISESFSDGNSIVKYRLLAQTDVLKEIFGATVSDNILSSKQACLENKASFYYIGLPRKQTKIQKLDCNGGDDHDQFMNHSKTSSEKSKLSQHKEKVNSHDGGGKRIDVSLSSSGEQLAIFSANYLIMPNSIFMQLRTGQENRILMRHPPSYVEAMCFESPQSRPLLSRMMGLIQHELEKNEPILPSSTYNLQQIDAVEYECPKFAEPFYPFLVDLSEVYKTLPGMKVALHITQKLLKNVEEGNQVDASELSASQSFRLAIEGLRVALHNSAVSALKSGNEKRESTVPFEDLPYEDKWNAILALALKQQAQRSRVVVAIIDAGNVPGICKHWKTSVPEYWYAKANECLILHTNDDNVDIEISKKRVVDKPIIIVGAGAAAVVGYASLSHWAPISTAMKIATFKMPLILKLILLKTKNGAVAVVSKVVNPVTKYMLPYSKGWGTTKFATGSKYSLLRTAGGTGKIRSAAHSVIATAERASLSAIRTSFYNAMRNRHRRGLRTTAWLGFATSLAAGVGLMTYDDCIENVIEAIPEASSITRLCQGVNNLRQASKRLQQMEDENYWCAMYNELYT